MSKNKYQPPTALNSDGEEAPAPVNAKLIASVEDDAMRVRDMKFRDDTFEDVQEQITPN